LPYSLHHMKVSSAVIAGWCIAVALLPTYAIAGPPFRTDDPEPVDYTHWEFYTFTSGTHISGDTSGVGPAFEFNYGLIPNGQLHIVAPTAFDSPAGGPTLFGYGDTEIGFKYRFIEEEKDGSRPQVGMFPLIELPTGNENRGLGAGHVRVFMGTGTEVAIQSAGITLVKGDLAGITRAIVLSRTTMRNIRQNLVFAFAYNAIGIPIAAGVLYPAFGLLLSPIIAALAMSLSSVSVIGNALRLRALKL
jgi:hypothetical protein